MMYEEFLQVSMLTEKDCTAYEYSSIVEPLYLSSDEETKEAWWKLNGYYVLRRLLKSKIAKIGLLDDMIRKLGVRNINLQDALEEINSTVKVILAKEEVDET